MPNTVQPNIPPPSTPIIEEEKKDNKVVYLLVAIIILLGILVFSMIFYLSSRKTSSSQVAQNSAAPQFSGISGTLDFNGIAPAGSSVAIGVTTPGTPAVQTVATGVPPKDGASWNWPQAQPGSIYTVTAYLNFDGKIIAQSPPLTLAAPAEDESLTIDVTSSSFPQSSPAPQTSAALSGTVGIDGYVPSGSTISVGVAPIGQLPLNTVSSGILASDGVSWSWNGAITDQEYQVQASIISSGRVVATSPIVTMSAPAASEVLNINSTAQPPAPTPVGISGTINLNGSIPSNSYITLGYRTTGSPTFTPVSGNISATDNVSWSIPNLSSGQSYDIQAYLWVNSQPYSQSQILTIDAPAASEILTINSTPAPSTPGNNTINASCGGNQNNNWQANVTYNVGGAIQNASQYQVTIGTSSQNNNTYTTTVSPSNPNQQQSLSTPYILNNNVTYYIQYAYATCQTCGTFSSYSPSVALTCP